jgi:hypothetical protein
MVKLLRKNIQDIGERKKIKLMIIRIFFYCALVCFIASMAYIFIFSPLTQINKIDIEGTKELKKDEINVEMRNKMAGKYLGVISKKNFVLLPSEKLEQELSDKFRKIKTINISKHFPDKIIVQLEERRSLIIWCSGGPCYIVDEKGYAFSPADLDSREVMENNLIKLINESARPVDLGKQVLSESHLNYLLNLKDSLRKNAKLEIFDDYHTRSSVAEEVSVKTLDGWYIFLSSAYPQDESIEMLRILLEQKIQPEERKNLEYIDLRVVGKIYYKLKNIPQEEITSENIPEEEIPVNVNVEKEGTNKKKDKQKN